MSRWIPTLLFVTLVSTIYCGMNWYVLGRLLTLFGVPRRPFWFYIALAPLSLSFVLALILESHFGNWTTGAFFTLAMVWLGVCGLLVWLLLVQQVSSLAIPLPPRIWAIAVCVAAGALAVYAGVNAHTLTVRREQIPGLPIRVAHLSDIHIGSIGPALLADIIDRTNRLQPDLILITGDLVDNANLSTRPLVAQLRRLAAPTLFTSGNHEAYTGYDQVREMLATTPVRWLRNELLTTHGVTVLGLDNAYGTEHLRRHLPSLGHSPGFPIVMNHQPNGADLAAHAGVGLMLSGHVHNGQIWPFNYLVQTRYKYVAGRYQVGNMSLIVCRGTGTWGPRMRLWWPSEILRIKLRSG